MTLKIINLTQSDYDETLKLLNDVFTIQNKRDMNFEKEMPKIFKNGSKNAENHYGIKENGKLVSVLGIYPFDVEIMNERFKFSTVGNIATHPDFCGRGYMNSLLNFAMDELSKRGYDASRLGGLRHRYNRVGYEVCGQNYSFEIGSGASVRGKSEEIKFKKLTSNDKDELVCCMNLNKQYGFFVIRDNPDSEKSVYDTLTTWRNTPLGAYSKSGEMIGYMCVMPDGKTVSEIRAKDVEAYKNMIFSYQKIMGEIISFSLPAFDREAVMYFSSVADKFLCINPCNFKIINFEKVTDALMKLKLNHFNNLCEGSAVVGIKDYGNIELFFDGYEAGCKKTSKPPFVTLEKLEAHRYLFGPATAATVAETNPFLSSWLPLPLSWSILDSM